MITFKGGNYTIENLIEMHTVITDACFKLCYKNGLRGCDRCKHKRPCSDLNNFRKNLYSRIEQHPDNKKENPN